jgi:uncharacterized protein YdaU (DUF1376 family)
MNFTESLFLHLLAIFLIALETSTDLIRVICMNYYNFHIGDYARRTRHLSVLEDLFYRRLLDLYYTRETPLPLELSQLYRLTMANDETFREALRSVLSEFFRQTEEGWVNARADEEIAVMREKQQKQRERANKRWKQHADGPDSGEFASSAMPDTCDGNASDMHAAMPRHTEMDAAASKNDAAALPPTPTPTPIPTPIPEPKEKKKQREDALLTPEGVPPRLWKDFLAIRTAKRLPLTANALADIEREARKAGLTLTLALEACSTHGWAGFKADWIARIQAATSTQRAPPAHFNRQVAIEESNRAVAEAFIKEMEAQDAPERTQ